jgi:hypothetical protein
VMSTPAINWKGGTPGNPYITGDTVAPGFNTITMVSFADPDTLTINLPPITPGSAGQRVMVRNLVNKKSLTPGHIIIAPDLADSFETFSTGQVATDTSGLFVHYEFESDGVGRWNHVVFGGGGTSIWG